MRIMSREEPGAVRVTEHSPTSGQPAGKEQTVIINRRILPLAVALSLAGSALLAACGDQPKPQTVVIAVTATANEPAPSLSEPTQALVRRAIDTDGGSAMLLTVANGQPVTIDGSIDLRLLRDGSDQIENNDTLRTQKSTALLAQLQGRLQSIDSGMGGLDMLGLLVGVGRQPGEATVLVVSSAVQGTDPVNLGVLGFDFDPNTVVDDLQARNLMPNLSGKTVIFVGMGDVAGAQPALNPAARGELTDLWLAVCRRAGAVSCDVDPTPAVATPPAATTPVPVVPVPDPSTMVIDPATPDQALPSEVLFEPNSATLRPGASDALRPLADRIITERSRVHLVGHVWKVTDADDRDKAIELSTARAQAVRDLLVNELKVPADQVVEVRGAGFDEPITLPGQADQQQVASANRVVQAALTPPAS